MPHFELRFEQWLRTAGLNRTELATLIGQATTQAEVGTKSASLARGAVLWLLGSTTETIPPPLLLDLINEYTESVRREASRGIQRADELRRMADLLIASAEHDPLAARPLRHEPLEHITDREHQVLCLIANALSNRQIAVTLNISEKTVKNHITSLFAKLGVSGRTEALLVALREGMLVAEHLRLPENSPRQVSRRAGMTGIHPQSHRGAADGPWGD